MDEELKTWLGAMETRIDQRFEARLKNTEARFDARLQDTEARLEERFDARLDARLDEAFTRFSQHILNEVGSRFEEVKARFDSVDARFDSVDARFDSVDARLKLQAGLIQSGARAMARFSEFSELRRAMGLAGGPGGSFGKAVGIEIVAADSNPPKRQLSFVQSPTLTSGISL
jgi:hypothetical protein